MRRGFAIIASAVIAVLLAACGGTSSKHYTGTVPSSRAALIRAFPASVQPLLTNDIPTPVIASLLKVRRSGPGTLVDWDSGGQLYQGEQIAYINNWEKITGWKVKDIAPVITPGQLKAQVASGHPNFDLFETGSNGDAMNEQAAGLMAPLDMSVLGPDLARFPKGQGFQWTKDWLQYGYFGVLLIWDTRKWPMTGPHPTTPSDLFNVTKFPGKRCLYKFPEYAGTLEYPLLAEGVPFSKLYPLDVKRAFAKLNTIKGDTVWWDSGAASISDITSGECAMGVTWNGRPALAVKANPSLPIGASWKDILLVDSGWAIPKGAANAQAANSLLGYDFTPKNQCRFFNALGYGIPMDESCINTFGRKWGVTAEHVKEAAGHQSPGYYAHHIDSLINQFNAWLTS